MLTVLGGLLGSGRATLADKLAIQFGPYHYDIAQKKLREPTLDWQGNFKVRQPKTDDECLRVYEKVLKEFSLLSKMYSDVIIDDAFYREIPREYFLSEAQKYYAPVVFIWIESDESSVKLRLERMQKLRKIRSVKDAERIRKRTYAMLQPPPPTVPRFICMTYDEEQVAALWELIQQHA